MAEKRGTGNRNQVVGSWKETAGDLECGIMEIGTKWRSRRMPGLVVEWKRTDSMGWIERYKWLKTNHRITSWLNPSEGVSGETNTKHPRYGHFVPYGSGKKQTNPPIGISLRKIQMTKIPNRQSIPNSVSSIVIWKLEFVWDLLFVICYLYRAAMSDP